MRKITLILFALVAFLIHAQNLIKLDPFKLENDTIYCGNSEIILTLPSISIKRVQIDKYEEGFFRFYTLIFPGRPSDAFYIVFQYGALAELSLPEPDSLIYKCRLGNIANSIYFTSNGKYFRRDTYNNYHIKAIFGSVAEDDLEFANHILDNLKIYRVSKQ